LCSCLLVLNIFNFLLEVFKFTLNSCHCFSCKLLTKVTFILCSRLGGCWCC
jgi:hypothetical protein